MQIERTSEFDRFRFSSQLKRIRPHFIRMMRQAHLAQTALIEATPINPFSHRRFREFAWTKRRSIRYFRRPFDGMTPASLSKFELKRLSAT